MGMNIPWRQRWWTCISQTADEQLAAGKVALMTADFDSAAADTIHITCKP